MPMPVNPKIVTNDVLEIIAYTWMDSQLSMNRFHYACSTHGGVGVSLSTILNILSGFYKPVYQQVLCAVANYLGVSGRIISPSARKTTLLWNKDKAIGLGGANPLPKQTAGMFTKVTGSPGRLGRGRSYIPFPSTADQSPGLDVPTAGYMTNLGLLAGVMAAQRVITGGGADTVTLDPVLAHLGPPVTYLNWNTATARQKWATHRSRGDYGRFNPIPDALA